MAKKEETKDKVINIPVNRDTNVTITDFLDTDYKSYVFYVLANRALPSLCDGFKTGARKIMHAAFNGGLKNGAQKKLLNLSGDTLNLSLYPHGDASLNGTISTMAQEFRWNLFPLYIDGQNGSLRSPKAISAPRYLYVQLSKYANIWKTDYDLLNFIDEEGQMVEPEHYYPIIPVVLAQSQTGMAPGYKFSTMSYNPVDLIDGCIKTLNSDKDENRLDGFTVRPYIRGVDNKKSWKMEDGVWVSYGEFDVELKRSTIHITALPYDQTFEGFEKLLNKLVEKGECKDWKNFSEGETIRYDVIYQKGQLQKEFGKKVSPQRVQNKFKLRSAVKDDLLWVLDENGKIKHFITPQELIEYFTMWRVKLYDERKTRLVKVLEDKFEKNSQLVKFIELVCKGKLKIRNRSKVDIRVDMQTYELPMELISTPMSRCTIEERDELLEQNKQIQDELEYIRKTTTKQMYLNDLNTLRKQIDKDFK